MFFNILQIHKMAIYMRRNGRTDWCPDCAEQKREKNSINPGYRNEERSFIGTVNSTARMLNLLSEESLTEEAFYDGLSKNAQHIGVSEDILLQLARETLEQENKEKKD